MFQGSMKCVSRKFQRCFKEDFRVFHKVSSVLHESFKEVPKVFEESFKGVSRIIQGCFIKV